MQPWLPPNLLKLLLNPSRRLLLKRLLRRNKNFSSSRDPRPEAVTQNSSHYCSRSPTQLRPRALTATPESADSSPEVSWVEKLIPQLLAAKDVQSDLIVVLTSSQRSSPLLMAKPLRIIVSDAASVSSRRAELAAFATSHDLDALLLSETYLSPRVPSPFRST